MPWAVAVQHPSMWADDQLLAACEIRRQRRSGPGGQHRNKVETGIIVTHPESGVSVSATERRSQEANLRQAIHRLRIRLAIQCRTPAEPPTQRWKDRCVSRRLMISRNHRDYPAILAELLNQLAVQEWNDDAAAKLLGCSRSSLMRILRREPEALAMVNRQRAQQGMAGLR